MFPLHSELSLREQQRVYEPPPSGKRKIVIATHVAEASITIEDIVYVIDTGRARLLNLNPETQISTPRMHWIGRSNAEQRKGRAGRCRAGSYFTLFSSVQYEQIFPEVHEPEMQRTQLETLCLQVKAMGFDHVLDGLWMCPSPPAKENVDSAMRTLVANISA